MYDFQFVNISKTILNDSSKIIMVDVKVLTKFVQLGYGHLPNMGWGGWGDLIYSTIK